MRKLLFLFTLAIQNVVAQSPDSLYHRLPEAEIRYDRQGQRLRLLSSESVIDTLLIGKAPVGSVISAVNTAPGVRMEERSPGSYRLSVRGSLLRSPFGIRNVKIYLGDLPFTDAGGNTYLNSLDLSNAASIRILKGPESSIFGANTGGVLLIDPAAHPRDSIAAHMAFSAGSYGLLHESTGFARRWKRSEFSFVHAYQRSDGYRDNSALQKHFIQLSEKWQYHRRASLRLLFLFSDLGYQTPGGLTLQQFEADPSAARPATATLPGAVQQKASISNRTTFGGMTHELRLTSKLRHVVSVFSGHTDFANPFITNYETRKESTLGARTYFELGLGKSRLTAKFNLGGEWQQTFSRIDNYGNSFGNKTALTASDNIHAQQAFLFSRALIDVFQKVLVEASLSCNFTGYSYRSNYPDMATAFSHRSFNPQWMPGVSASYGVVRGLAWRVSARSGYSAPTVAEVRSSDNVVNTSLEAETGVSYETGLRYNAWNDRLRIDASVFYFRLGNAIVRRLNEDGTEYFINAGGTSQPGIEGQAQLELVRPEASGWLHALKMTMAGTYNRFEFRNYRVAETDYSGNALTGVPRFTGSATISADLPSGISLFTQYYYASEIPLNDAGSVYAGAYHLLQARAEWTRRLSRAKLTFFLGADNLLNQRYSLGNDLNAAGGRYYNAAAPRNYYGGLRIAPQIGRL